MVAFILLEFCALVLLLGCSGFFSSAEVAYFSLNEVQLNRLEQERPVAGLRIRQILSAPTRLLSTILIGNTVVNVCASVLCFTLVRHFAAHHAEKITIVLMTVLLLIFGEVGPKRIAMLAPDRMAVAYAPLLLALMPFMAPVRVLMENITEAFQHTFRRRERTLSEEEFESAVDLSEQEGVLDEEEHIMVKAIIRLEDLQASDVMTPRVDIIGIDLDATQPGAEDYMHTARVRRVLLYRKQLDNVDGLLDVNRYMLDPEHRIENAWLLPLFVPESAPLDKLLAQFQKGHRRAAVVVDEYGGTAGIITRGDILEEITGEIDDEHAEHKLHVEELGDERWLVDGRLSLEEINERFDLELEGEGEDRIAGWVTRVAEHLPRPGEMVESQGCRATVQRIRKHRIELVLLEKLQGRRKT